MWYMNIEKNNHKKGLDQFSECNSYNEENLKFVQANTGCIKNSTNWMRVWKKVLRLYSHILEKKPFNENLNDFKSMKHEN